ncbi:MAG: response regulator [Deltaproteobacteria bacterium]|nr:response regulator [Deltaproteobacteria bacterium]
MSLDETTSRVQILLVEDDEAIRIMLLELLRREGFTALSAGDGLEASVLLSNVTPDLVVTDYNMPHMDGWELALYVRRRFPLIPVLLVTGEPDGLSRAHHAGSPFNAVLGKPFQLHSLLSMIHALLNKGAQPKRRSHGPELPHEYQPELG